MSERIGSSMDDFLREEGLLREAAEVARRRTLAWAGNRYDFEVPEYDLASPEEVVEILKNGLELASAQSNASDFAHGLGGMIAALGTRGVIPPHVAVRSNQFLASLCREAGLGWMNEGEADEEP